MADRHKLPPLTFRPPADIRAWLAELAHITGEPIGAIITESLREHKERQWCPDPKGPIGQSRE
jgi:hypothetical protein